MDYFPLFLKNGFFKNKDYKKKKKKRTFAKIYEELFPAPFFPLNYPRTIDSEKWIAHCDYKGSKIFLLPLKWRYPASTLTFRFLLN